MPEPCSRPNASARVAANLRRRQMLDAAAAATTQPAEARPTKAPEARRAAAPLTARAGR